MNERDIFLSALEIEDPTARQAHLQAACGGDAALLASVESLLASHGQSQFLNTPVVNQIADLSATEPAETMLLDRGSTEDREFPDIEFSARGRDTRTKNEDDDENPLGYLVGFLQPSSRPDSKGRLAHYEVLEVLGRGAFGIVLKAFDAKLERIVAIKVLAPEMAATSPARKRFLREAKASAAIRHENVVAIHAVEEQPLPYLVMEYIPGKTLQQRLDDAGPLAVIDVLRLGRQIAEGLAAAAAQGLIHRDIKPGNILLEAGVHERVKITDFGLARAADDASLTQSGIIAGTPMYMAPEQALGKKLDQRADLFSLGSVLYQMVSGRPPFRASSTLAILKRVTEDSPRPITEVIPETPRWLCDIVAKLHAKNPDDRYQSAQEVADLLADCESQLKDHSQIQDLSLLPRTHVRPWSWWKGAATVITVFLLAVCLYALNRPTVRPGLDVNEAGLLPTPGSTLPGVKPKAIPLVEEPGPQPNGWVQLFNGKDLTGWKFHPNHLGDWQVQDGILKGSTRQSHLFSQRDDYENFHLRAEVKINLGGDSGILFRAPFELQQGRTPTEFGLGGCYEAELQQNRIYARPTGSISESRGDAPPNILGRALNGSLTQPDEWFTYEVIAANNHFVTKINGVEAANCDDLLERHRKGHLALQVWHRNTLVQFRKIEIMELPPSQPVERPWVQLFNGKDMTGWKTHPDQPGDWTVNDGVLVGSKVASYLFSDGDKFENFHLRIEGKINQGGDSGIFFRSPFSMRAGRIANSLRPAGGYEVELHRNLSHQLPAGSLWNAESAGAPKVLSKASSNSLITDDEWFTVEILASGSHFVTKVNGTVTVECEDPEDKFQAGHFALQVLHPPTVVQFRKIEIKELPAISPPAITKGHDADVQRITALPAEEQVQEVRKVLMTLNPRFDGKLDHKIEAGVVTELKLITDEIVNISPVRALRSLVSLNLGATPAQGRRSNLSDISPLRGLRLTHLDLCCTEVTTIDVVNEMPLKSLSLDRVPVTDLSPLSGKVLKTLHIGGTKVISLRDVPITSTEVVHCHLSQISDKTELLRWNVRFLDLWGVPTTVDPERLRDLKPPLSRVNGRPLEEFLKDIESKNTVE